jgi:rod shape-determining protein MreD
MRADAMDGFIKAIGLFAPVALGVLGVLLTALPYGSIAGIPLAPQFGLAVLFFWTLHRPDLFPPLLALGLGLFADLLLGTPLGLWALLYTLASGLVLSMRAFFVGAAAYPAWFGFAIVTLVVAAAGWLVASLYYGMLLSPLGIAGQMVVTLALYPLVASVLGWFERRLAEPEE